MDEQQLHDDEGQHDKIRPWPLIGGGLLGFCLTWFAFAVTVIALYATYGDTSSRTQDVIAGVGLLGLPVLFALLLVPRRTRYWGAGLLLGVALGSITAAGVCGGFLGVNAA